MAKDNSIVIFQDKGKSVSVIIDPEQDTVWATHQQIADLFDIDRTGATRHINNILKAGEVDEKSNVQKMHIASSDRPVKLYSLDVILSVGYRANSAKAIEFRKWTNKALKQYIVQGAAINERRLKQIGAVASILSRSNKDMKRRLLTCFI
jgi:hypothetical protein